MSRVLALTAVCAALLLTVGSASASAGQYDHLLAPKSVCANQNNTSASVAKQEHAMLCMHNYVRAKMRRPRLATRSMLMSSSGSKSADIVRCRDFSHTACGRETLFFVKRVGYTSGGCWGAGENIAWGSGWRGSARSIMRAWLHSTGHRRNILNSRFRDKGVGLVKGSFGGYPNAQVWTTHFGYRC